jgi:hypothetical protein
MKKLLLLSILFIAFNSCEGDPGPPGFDGLDGVNILGKVFDVTVDFTPNNGYSNLIAFPNNIEVFESDVVLVFLLEEQISDPSGPIDVWTPLPQTFFLDNGLQVVYNFNHTFLDVNLFLDGNVNLDTLGLGFTNNQTFRIAVLPADFAENFDVDLNSHEEVMETLKSQNANFKVKSL